MGLIDHAVPAEYCVRAGHGRLTFKPILSRSRVLLTYRR